MANTKKSFFQRLLGLASICAIVALLLCYSTAYVHPESGWFYSFFGLAYPVILVFVIVILMFQITRKSFWALAIIATLLGNYKLHSNFVSLPFGLEKLPTNLEDPADTLRRIKLMSYNVRLFDLYNPDLKERNQNRDSIFSLLDREQPDVLCFQEFFHQDKPSDFKTKDTLVQFLKANKYHERYSQRARHRQNFGIAIFSRFPMIAKGDIMFDDPDNNDNNYCVFADIVNGLDTFRVYNVHLQSIKFQQDDYAIFGEQVGETVGVDKSNIVHLKRKLQGAFLARANQSIRLMEHVKQCPYRVILCGDFNDTPASYAYHQFRMELKDAFVNSAKGLGNTYAGKVPAGRIDYIMHDKTLHSANFKIYNKHKFSDHYAISCIIWP